MPLSLALGLACAPTYAQTQACKWGEPGYRACVDEKIARKREQDRQREQEHGKRQPSSGQGAREPPKTQELYPTAPPQNRAPATGVPLRPRAAEPLAPQRAPDTKPMMDEYRWQRDVERYRDRNVRQPGLRAREDMLQLDFDRQTLDRNSDAPRYGVGQRQFDINILRGQQPFTGLPPPP